ncbi:MAG: hypothetical protein IT360_22750 [Gemmatimonadaceae bacterium]|nr:hypothetical protein [Gemmatimonadaceae bacterium]
MTSQNFATHTRRLPAYHFVVVPLLLLNIVLNVRDLVKAPSLWTLWGSVLAVTIFLGILLARTMALTAQDRIIRLEETLRLQRLLPVEQHGEIASITRGQFIALRFASDAELPALFQRVRNGEFANPKAIKQAITSWRPDLLRV